MSAFRNLPVEVLQTQVLPRLTDQDAISLIDEVCPDCVYRLKGQYKMSEWLEMPENIIPNDIIYDLPTLDELKYLPETMNLLMFGTNTTPVITEPLVELPKYITRLYLMSTFQSSVIEFPEVLKMLVSTSRNLPTLPDTVERLILFRFNNHSIPLVPSQLMNLTLIDHSSVFPSLPNGFRKLDIQNSSFEFPQSLPNNLETLILEKYTDTSDRPIRLPPNLKTLKIINSKVKLSQQLPPNLVLTLEI